jgi:hypothetical protein
MTEAGLQSRCIDNLRKGYIYIYFLSFNSGEMILKREADGFHLRWVAVDESFLYWIDPKDNLRVKGSDVILLDKIKAIIVSPDALILQQERPDPDLVRAYSLSFTFMIYSDGVLVEFAVTSKVGFETWILGLKTLCPKATVIQGKSNAGFSNAISCYII